MKQKCTHCKIEKELIEFGNHKSRLNGKAHCCLECRREIDRERMSTKAGFAKTKKYQQSERGKELRRLRQKRDYWENKHKYSAKKIIAYMIEIGELKRMPCEVCGAKRTFGHHPDYSKPREVVWLCQKHHSEVHRK